MTWRVNKIKRPSYSLYQFLRNDMIQGSIEFYSEEEIDEFLSALDGIGERIRQIRGQSEQDSGKNPPQTIIKAN